ncbi:MAG TPA: hypothetical protein VHC90_21320 [Bryobacteraceae bacterium]|nr:hypothetical protein [Bryobacteraceae bacterium]
MFLLLLPVSAFAQAADPEPAAVIEAGGAASRAIGGGSSSGGDLAVEFTPIEHWLEIEAGTAGLFAHGSSEWDTDLLFKKPWTLSRTVEFMIGAGPEWVHTRDHGIARNAAAGSVALDFMFWPKGQHKVGWFLEPEYDYTFGHDHERSVGMSFGLLFGVAR